MKISHEDLVGQRLFSPEIGLPAKIKGIREDGQIELESVLTSSIFDRRAVVDMDTVKRDFMIQRAVEEKLKNHGLRQEEDGRVSMLLSVGDAYFYGLPEKYAGNKFDMERDPARAETWYSSAAERGSTEAMLKLGDVKYRRGDLEGAINWWDRAAEMKPSIYSYSAALSLSEVAFCGLQSPVDPHVKVAPNEEKFQEWQQREETIGKEIGFYPSLGKEYVGPVVHYDDRFGSVLQSVDKKPVLHRREDLESLPAVGQNVEIRYGDREELKATVSESGIDSPIQTSTRRLNR